MLAMKRSPLRMLFGASYEGQANFMHRWMGHNINSLLSTHAYLYLAYFWDTARMKTRFLEFDVQCGFWAFVLISIVVLSAGRWVRNWSYRLFFLIHVSASPLLFPLMFLHVPHMRPYLWVSLALYASDVALRYLTRVPAMASVEHLSPTLIAINAYPAFETTIRPGTHVIIRHTDTALTSHPFSITSAFVPSGAVTKRLRMVARIRSGFTKKLADMPTQAAAYPEGIHGTSKMLAIQMDLPYGAPLYFPDLKKFDNILFVAGGIGATFAASWVKFLLKGADACQPGQVRFVWAVKTPEDAMWAFQDDFPGDNASDLAAVVELYITGGEDNGEDGIEMTEGLLRGVEGGEGGEGGVGPGIEALVKAGVAFSQLKSSASGIVLTISYHESAVVDRPMNLGRGALPAPNTMLNRAAFVPGGMVRLVPSVALMTSSRCWNW